MEITVNSEILSDSINSIENILKRKEILTIVITVIIAIIAKLYLGSRENKTFIQSIFEIILWIILGFIIIANSLKYFFDIEILTTISKLLTNNPLIEIDVSRNNDDKKKEKKVQFSDKNEVFHISGNKYAYEEAEPICKAHGARLATYDDIEKSYMRGGEWCEYGWSDNQLALFPTQKKTWSKLQSEDNKNICGRPGINGGYMENPNIRFGVNCYGIKPDITNKEKCLMNNTSYYSTPDEKVKDDKVSYWESQISNMLISPFNENKWSRI